MVDDFDLNHPLSVGTHIHQVLLLVVKAVRLDLREEFLAKVVLVPKFMDLGEKEAGTLFKVKACIEPAIAKAGMASFTQKGCSLLLKL